MPIGLRPGLVRNHPLEIRRLGGADDSIDTRHTPPALYAKLDHEFHFTLDVAASKRNALCRRFFDKAKNGLRQSWASERVWCNPPFSAISSWVYKACVETIDRCPLAAMLLPANRTDQAWWQELIEPLRDRGRGIETRFLRGRVRFATDRMPAGAWKSNAPFGLVIVIFTPEPRRRALSVRGEG